VTERDRDGAEDIAELRNALATLMGRNVELEQRIETLERERNELGVDEVARSLVRSSRVAAAEMADAGAGEDAPGVRYVIPRLDVTMRGIVGRRGAGFGIRFPGPEERAAAPALSTISMSVAHVPAPPIDREHERFRAGLEAAQATLSAWAPDRGRKAAGEIAAQATHLLSLRLQWGDAETVAGIQALTEAFGRFGTQASAELDAAARDRFVGSAKTLSALARRIDSAGRASAEDLDAVGSALADLAHAVRATRR
jgi:hypothetical protein